jgi:hypothetical protein
VIPEDDTRFWKNAAMALPSGLTSHDPLFVSAIHAMRVRVPSETRDCRQSGVLNCARRGGGGAEERAHAMFSCPDRRGAGPFAVRNACRRLGCPSGQAVAYVSPDSAGDASMTVTTNQDCCPCVLAMALKDTV